MLQTGAGQNAPVRSDKTGLTSHIDALTEKSITAYEVINRFLQAFIDHVCTQLYITIIFHVNIIKRR